MYFGKYLQNYILCTILKSCSFASKNTKQIFKMIFQLFYYLLIGLILNITYDVLLPVVRPKQYEDTCCLWFHIFNLCLTSRVLPRPISAIMPETLMLITSYKSLKEIYFSADSTCSAVDVTWPALKSRGQPLTSRGLVLTSRGQFWSHVANPLRHMGQCWRHVDSPYVTWASASGGPVLTSPGQHWRHVASCDVEWPTPYVTWPTPYLTWTSPDVAGPTLYVTWESANVTWLKRWHLRRQFCYTRGQ